MADETTTSKSRTPRWSSAWRAEARRRAAAHRAEPGDRAAGRAIERVIRNHRAWAREIAPELEASTRASLERELTAGEAAGIGRLACALDTFGLLFGVRGLVAVFDGAPGAGWRDISTSLAYRYWALKLEASEHFPQAFVHPLATGYALTNWSGRAACLLCCGIGAGQAEYESFASHLLLAVAATPGAAAVPAWERRAFEPFTLHLLHRAGRLETPPSAPDRNVGPFAAVLRAWEEPPALAAELRALCEYHCAKMEERSGSVAEFDQAPFDLLPVEVWAVEQVRRGLGLPTPRVRHPLLQTPAAHCDVAALKVVDDPLLRRVERLHTARLGLPAK